MRIPASASGSGAGDCGRACPSAAALPAPPLPPRGLRRSSPALPAPPPPATPIRSRSPVEAAACRRWMTGGVRELSNCTSFGSLKTARGVVVVPLTHGGRDGDLFVDTRCNLRALTLAPRARGSGARKLRIFPFYLPTISDPATAIAEARWRRTAASSASPCWQSVSSPAAPPPWWILAAMAHASWYFNPVECPCLPPGPCARVHSQLTHVSACSLSKMLRGGGGCLPCKHWTNAPSVVTWFRCVPATFDFLSFS